ncbi:MAG: stage II sporulation protein M [Firmicutes bacterium]|nr:stage II sporulation protein M [Bacillota bacterium]
MKKNSNSIIRNHFHKNIFLYFIIVIFLIVGISAGAITTKVLNTSQKKEIINFMDSFFKILNEESINSGILFKHSIINNIKTVGLLWFLGIIIVGIPLVFIVVVLRGFIIGFTVGFLYVELGFKGFLFAILAILPQNLFLIPGIVIISVMSLSFSIRIIKNKFKRSLKFNYLSEIIRFSLSVILLFILMLLGSLVEAYITPVFMKLVLGYVA